MKCIKADDPFIDYGEKGVVTNTAPARPLSPALAFVTWDNDCRSKMAASDLEVIPDEPIEPKPPIKPEISHYTGWQRQQEAS